jgi:hypothetical protein
MKSLSLNALTLSNTSTTLLTLVDGAKHNVNVPTSTIILILVLNLLPTSVGFYFNCYCTHYFNKQYYWRCNMWCIVWLVVRNDVFVLTCIATNIKISTSWFDVNFYFVYYYTYHYFSHIFMWRLFTRFVMMVIHNSSQT